MISNWISNLKTEFLPSHDDKRESFGIHWV